MVPSLASSALIVAVLVMSSEETNLLICNLTLPSGGSSLPTVVHISFLCKDKKDVIYNKSNSSNTPVVQIEQFNNKIITPATRQMIKITQITTYNSNKKSGKR